MSSNILPTLPGVAYPIVRTPQWATTIQQNISGREVRIANQIVPTWRWELTYNILRSAAAYNEYQQLVGFFNKLQGQFDTFLYQDVDDNAITGQALGLGDGTTTAFQLVRSFGGFIEPILAPHVVSKVYLNGVNQPSGWSVSNWGAASPGVITFTTPPGSGVAVSADFTYYWPCRMDSDSLAFNLMMQSMYELKKFSFVSVK